MSAKPSLDLLRSLTEEHILRALMSAGKLTRSDIAALTGISKPTISGGVRRLTEAGLVLDTGERTTGRGQAGSYYTLSPTCGAVLVMSISPNGVVAEAIDAFGEVSARSTLLLGRDVPVDQVAKAVRATAAQISSATVLPLRTAVLSAADPVDRVTGRLVHLPDAPFLVGDLDPVTALAGLVEGPVMVDNDVNWAARAQHAADSAVKSDNFLYLHLGEGLGCAVVSDGDVWRGHSGLAGEVAHLVTWGPDGRAMHLTEVFAELGLRRESSTAIDVEALQARIGADGPGPDLLAVIARAIVGAMMAAIALADPECIVVGGSWGRSTLVIEALGAEFARLPRQVAVVGTTLGADPDFCGARDAGLDQLRDLIVGELRRGDLDTTDDVAVL
ncbi:ROK family transcriptional regulator [Nocardioides zeicaulis]|uniref:ROK family protein n=1 Tax=Nocardioides zeicaulis TaxID=1776857 RepID=A0ABV6DWR2_9ACTN